MREVMPYNAGELRIAGSSGKKVMICGHIWWPVEKCNAYHCIAVNEYGEPSAEAAQYIWDDSKDAGGKWPVFTPKERKAA